MSRGVGLVGCDLIATQLTVAIRVAVATHFPVAIGFAVTTPCPVTIRLVSLIAMACGGATSPVLPRAWDTEDGRSSTQCRLVSPLSHCLSLRWFRSHVVVSGVRPQLGQAAIQYISH
ncbi:hypothetical protein Taro_025802 [Colocasia esculenta]|uniref:Uncharacterized protein n=1 Tax=Colocasia esculenta TaxID=4460 RepID=A0A843VLL4_COLES|nr:hypothetical protein [Colocasia esculenta]